VSAELASPGSGRWRVLLQCAALVGYLLFASVEKALAHPAPVMDAILEITGEWFELEIECDFAALVMQAPQGHLGKTLAEELRTLSDAELSNRINDALQSFLYYLQVEFDGVDSTPSWFKRVPTAESLRAAVDHAHAENFTTLKLIGKVPAGAEELRLAFPEPLGRVRCTIIVDGKQVRIVEAAPPGSAQSISLRAAAPDTAARPRSTTAADVIPLVALAIAVLALLFWKRR
jgi:hypothetical protein